MPVLTHFPLLKALGWALFNSLWQMAALWLLYSLLMAIFHKTASRTRHYLALLFLGIGTIWSGVTFGTALLFPANPVSFWLPALSPARSAAPGWFWQNSRTFIDAVLSGGSTLYLLILSGLLIRYSHYYRQSGRLTRNGLSPMPPEFRVFVSSTALQLGIRTPVKAWLSSRVDVPFTLGFLKPVILVPAAMITRLTPQQVEAILIHELAHIQRKDYLLHLAVTLLEGLFFFNPFARLLIRALNNEREHCCDDLVLQFKYDPHAYVSALLSLAFRNQPLQKLALAATGSGDKLLLQRARRILLKQKGERGRPGTRTMLLLLFTGLITALTFYSPAQPARKTAPVAAAIHPRTTPAAPLTAASVKNTLSLETANAQPIYFSAPSPAAAARPRQHTRPGTHPRRETAISEPGNLNSFFANTDGDGANLVDGDPTPIPASGDDVTDAVNAANALTAANVAAARSRDYSLNMPATIVAPGATLQQGAPFVPNSSFGFQYTIGDSARPEEQLIYLQQSAQFEVLAAMTKLQQQTEAKLKALNDLRPKAAESVQLRRSIQAQQLKIQQDYLQKITSWQKKLEKTTHVRVVVYI
jgi:beta-lactamase regulating signal transducer with metallopeptidase domain